MELDREYSVVAAAPRNVDRYALRIPQQVYQLLRAPHAAVEIEFDEGGDVAVLLVGDERFVVSAADKGHSDSVIDCFSVDINNHSSSSSSSSTTLKLTYEGKVSKRLQVFSNIDGMMGVAHEKTSLEHAKRDAPKVVRIDLPGRLVKAKEAEARAAEARAAEARAAEARATEARAAEVRAAKKAAAAKKAPAAKSALTTPTTTSNNSSSRCSTLFLRIEKTPAEVTFENIENFFGGIKIVNIYAHCARVASGGADTVYVEFESANGCDLALQRSGEELLLGGSKGSKRTLGEAAVTIALLPVSGLETFFVKGSCIPLTAKRSSLAACAVVLSAGLQEDSPLPLAPRLLPLLVAKSPSMLLEEWLYTVGIGESTYALDASYIGSLLPGAGAIKRRRISEAVVSHDDRCSLHDMINACSRSAGSSRALAQMFMEDGSAELAASLKDCNSDSNEQLSTLLRTYAEAAGLLDDTWISHLLCNDHATRASAAYIARSDYVCRARDMCEGILAAYWTHSIKLAN